MRCPATDTLLEIVERFPQGHDGSDLDVHLDQCDPCRRLLADLVRAAAADQRSTVPLRSRRTVQIVDDGLDTEPTPSQVPLAAGLLCRGDVVGRYVIRRLVGFGGMGYVYAAHDPELDREVALKIVRPHVPGLREGEARARLLAEAQLLARLVHPNVVTVFDVGNVGDRLFLAMELVDGITVAEWLRQRPRGWREILDVFRAAGRGLVAAHAKGIIHRDFKAANILIDRDGRVLVTDFGLARLIAEPHRSSTGPAPQPRGSAPSFATHAGQLLGTPPYMAPEQHRGERADRRSDQFSFCVALHEALYGELPFDGKTYEELRRAITEERPRDPPKGAPVPGWIRDVLVRGLAQESTARWPSIEAVLAELDAKRHARRRWALASLAVIVVGGACVVGAIGLGQRAVSRDAGLHDRAPRAGLNLAAIAPTELSSNDLAAPNLGASGIGSTVFANLVERNRFAGDTMHAVLWRGESRWLAVLWGTRANATFVVVTPANATWDQVAAFVRAVWRWNAPPTMTLELGGVAERGKLGAAALVADGTVTARDYAAGLLGFVTATMNSDESRVDLASWVRRADGTGQIVGGVVGPDTARVEAGFAVVDNANRSVAVWVTDPAGDEHELMSARYSEFMRGLSTQRPVANSCAFALINELEWNAPAPAARCEQGLQHEGQAHVSNAVAWTTYRSGAVPHGDRMSIQGADPSLVYSRCGTRGSATSCVERRVLSETYVLARGLSYELACGTTCDHDRAECGTISNRCDGGVLDCGACAPGFICSMNQCVTSTTEEVEPNDAAASARVIAAPFTNVSGTIARAGDRDYFAVTLPAGATLSALLIPPRYVNPPLDYELVLHASDGAGLAESIHMGVERIAYTNAGREPRVLYLEVYAYGDGYASATSPYLLNVEW